MGEEADTDWLAGLVEWGYADAKKVEREARFQAQQRAARERNRRKFGLPPAPATKE